jgi:hypothetical protein
MTRQREGGCGATDIAGNFAKFIGYSLCIAGTPRLAGMAEFRFLTQPIRVFSCRFAADSASLENSSTPDCGLPARDEAGFSGEAPHAGRGTK